MSQTQALEWINLLHFHFTIITWEFKWYYRKIHIHNNAKVKNLINSLQW